MFGAPRSAKIVRFGGPRVEPVRWPLYVAMAMLAFAALMATSSGGSDAGVPPARDAGPGRKPPAPAKRATVKVSPTPTARAMADRSSDVLPR